MTNRLLWEETLPGGATWSHILKRGTALRMSDLEGGANAAALFYNAANPAERYNMPDTLKAQHISRLTAGNVLFSDMGRVLCSVVGDTAGWHDPIGGFDNAELVRSKYGERSYQEARNGYYRNARDEFLIELAKYGLGERDLSACVNFFSKLAVNDKGGLAFVSGHSRAGAIVELRAEMNVLLILNTCPHPMDSVPAYSPKPVRIEILRSEPAATDDPCRLNCPENERGFVLTERYFT